MKKDLKGCVCVVTGASRGIGRGIAVSLGSCGATVYVTGRTIEPVMDEKSDAAPIGSLKEVEQEIGSRGGVGIAIALDHNDDKQVAHLFARIKSEQNGRLDLFVNNAYSAVRHIGEDFRNPRDGFWDLRPGESPGDIWDIHNRVGLRNAYVCCTLAAKTMLEYRDELSKVDKDARRKLNTSVDFPAPLIVNVSSTGGIHYFFNPAYTAGKAATDKMSADMGIELKRHKSHVSVISLWPGPVKTEEIQRIFASNDVGRQMEALFLGLGESTELSGRVLSHLMRQSPSRIQGYNGCIVRTAEYADSNWIRDVDGRYVLPSRSFKFILKSGGWHKLAWFVPGFLRVPDFILKVVTKKFA